MALEANFGGDGSIFVGEDKTIRLEVLDINSIPIDITTWVIRWVLRKNDNTADPPIFDKLASAVGVYNMVRAVNTQRAQVQLTDDELNTISAKTYRHSWKREDEGSETILSYGNAIIQLATAR